MKSPIIPLGDKIVILPQEEGEQQYGNIIVPDMGKEKNEYREVVAVGPGKHSITGELIPTKLKVGDTVVLPTMGFTKFPYDGVEYYVGPENQVLAKINDKKGVEEILEETSVTGEDIKNLKDL